MVFLWWPSRSPCKMEREKRGWGCSSAEVHLLFLCEDLGLIPILRPRGSRSQNQAGMSRKSYEFWWRMVDKCWESAKRQLLRSNKQVMDILGGSV